MIAAPAGLLLAAALLAREPGGETDSVESLPPKPTHGRLGWHCSTYVAIGPYRGSVQRAYGRKRGNAPYQMSLYHPNAAHHFVRWTVDPRSEGPPVARKRSRRSQVEAFRGGPDYVSLYFEWRTEALGPLWAHFWGDGAYVGGRKVMSAGKVRKGYTGTGVALEVALLEKLAKARVWTARIVDSGGKRLDVRTFELPTPEAAEREFGRARARINAVERRFRADRKPRDEGDTACFDRALAEGEI